jgi:hypothetical protein
VTWKLSRWLGSSGPRPIRPHRTALIRCQPLEDRHAAGSLLVLSSLDFFGDAKPWPVGDDDAFAADASGWVAPFRLSHERAGIDPPQSIPMRPRQSDSRPDRRPPDTDISFGLSPGDGSSFTEMLLALSPVTAVSVTSLAGSATVSQAAPANFVSTGQGSRGIHRNDGSIGSTLGFASSIVPDSGGGTRGIHGPDVMPLGSSGPTARDDNPDTHQTYIASPSNMVTRSGSAA